jgi:putative transposase
MDQDTLRFLLREAVRETVTEVLQTVLELDRTAFLQAHGGRRNGYYPRRLETTFGQVDLKVPRDREGQYYPAFLKPYARRLVDVGEVAVALYAAGVSQRKAAEVMGLFGAPAPNEPPPGPTATPTRLHPRPCPRWCSRQVEAFRRRPFRSRGDGLRLPGSAPGTPEGVPRAGEGSRSGKGVSVGPGGPKRLPGSRRVTGLLAPAGGERLGVREGAPGEPWQRGLRRALLCIADGLAGSPRSHPTGLPLWPWRGSRMAWRTGRGGAWGRCGPETGPSWQRKTCGGCTGRRAWGRLHVPERLLEKGFAREAWGSRYPGVAALRAEGTRGPFCGATATPRRLGRTCGTPTSRRGSFGRSGGGRRCAVRTARPPLPTSFPARRRCTSSCTWSRRGKKGGGRRGCFAKRTSCGSRGSRRRGRRWRRCFRSGMPPYTNAYTYILTRPGRFARA